MLLSIPSGLSEIIKTFGDCSDNDFEENNIVYFDLPYELIFEGTSVKKGRCHKLVVDNFIETFNLIAEKGFEAEVKNFSGIFYKKNMSGSPSKVSTHSWGISIDLEAEKYPLYSNKRFPERILTIFKKFGFYYGGDFSSRKDPMHFQLCTNY